jgi:membrane-associated phospholipid phosphatase
MRVGARVLPPVLVGAGVAALAVVLLLALGMLVGRWPLAWDRAVVVALRRADAPGVVIGPAAVAGAAESFTALGSGPVLTLVVAGAAGLLLVQRLWLTALLTVAATLSGSLAVAWIKTLVARARPALVPHLAQVRDLSFPSGHAANSAVVYLTLAGLATQVVRRRAPRRYLLGCAAVLVALIGASRVVLGVHWPSDVLAGWSFGTLWALAWWALGAEARAAIGGER